MCVILQKFNISGFFKLRNLVIPMCIFILRDDVVCSVMRLSGFVLKTLLNFGSCKYQMCDPLSPVAVLNLHGVTAEASSVDVIRASAEASVFLASACGAAGRLI